MKKLMIDTGVESFEITEGKFLRFNPADINVYNRLINAQDRIVDIERRLVEEATKIQDTTGAGEAGIKLLTEADKDMKDLLGEIFGAENDFEDIFAGVNLLSVAGNDERVITNFLDAITPVLEEGAKRTARKAAAQEVNRIRGNRAARRAQK